ncbi:MAG: ParB/RepB/Spo0J family partition protein, partial [Saccharofermentanales bacterium]
MTTQRQDTKSKRGLGRGLGAIFDVDASDAIDARDERVVELDIHQLIPNRDQPRQDFDEEKLDELARSIRDQGVISPLIVTPADTPDHYMIVAGERRWRAAQRAELKRIPVIIRDLETADVQRQALIDNVVREDLNAIEEAQAIQRLMDEHH